MSIAKYETKGLKSMGNNNGINDLLNALSLIVGIQNLQENREQTEYNDVQSANDNQARFLLQELGKKFDEQNEMLKKILELLEKENKNERK